MFGVGKRKTIGTAASKQVRKKSRNGTEITVFDSSTLDPGWALLPAETLNESIRKGVRLYSHLSFHVFLDAQITVTLEWNPNPFDEEGWIKEGDFIVDAQVDEYGRSFHQVVRSAHFRITVANSDVVPLTDLRISVYGNKHR